MKTLREKVAYISGLADGMDLDKEDSRTKLTFQILDLLQDMVEEMDDLSDRIDDNEDLVEALDQDLADVEEYVFDEDEDDCCDCHDDDALSEFEIQCPHCNEIVFVDEDELADAADDDIEIICPSCNQVIFSDDQVEDEQDAEAEESIVD